MTDNEIGYLIYKWEQEGYNFCPKKYNKDKDYTSYLSYFKNEDANFSLIRLLLERDYKNA